MASLNVLPGWWSNVFMGMQVAALLPMTFQHVFKPFETFMDTLPKGYDLPTDQLTSSKRVEIATVTAGQAYPMIIMMFVGCTLFAKFELKGQPQLQQKLMSIIIYTGLFSDIWLYSVVLFKYPRDLLKSPSLWNSSLKGLIFGLPGATVLKLVWLFGVGRDIV